MRRSYPKLSGMTGTALTEVSEFDSIYKLPVAVVPTNRAVARTDNPDVVYKTEEYKWRATVAEIRKMHKSGRPILVRAWAFGEARTWRTGARCIAMLWGLPTNHMCGL